MKSARTDGERLFKLMIEKCGNTLCARKGYAASVKSLCRQRLQIFQVFQTEGLVKKIRCPPTEIYSEVP